MSRFGHVKSIQMQIVRSKHTVTFPLGVDALQLYEWLGAVPSGAKLIDVIIPEREDDGVQIVFQEEEPKP